MKHYYETNTVDLHGYLVREAEQIIADKLDELYEDYPDEFDKLIIIHGYSHGDQLLQMVRHCTDYRIRQIRGVKGNPGMTIYDLYSWDQLPDPPVRKGRRK